MRCIRSRAVPALFAGTVLAGLATAAVAADPPTSGEGPQKSGPYVAGTVDLELQDDYTFSSDDPGAEINDLFFTGEAGLEFGINENFALVSGLVLEPVLDPAPGEDRFLGDHGLFAETLFLQAKFGGFTFIGGKLNPGFGTAWDITPGIYGVDFAEDYEVTEMLGFGASYAFTTPASGTHTVGANGFFADTTVLSESLFTNRGRTTLGAGGAANTEEFNSFTLTLDGSDMRAMPGFTYHIAFRHLAAGMGDVDDENGFVIGATKAFRADPETTIQLIGEAAFLFNAFAGPDDVYYFTGGLGVGRGPWHGEVAGTVRRTDVAGGGSFTDYLFQVSAGREIHAGIDLSLGYRYDRQATIDSHTVGFLLTKSFEFDTRN